MEENPPQQKLREVLEKSRTGRSCWVQAGLGSGFLEVLRFSRLEHRWFWELSGSSSSAASTLVRPSQERMTHLTSSHGPAHSGGSRTDV